MLIFNDSKVRSEASEYKHILVTFIYLFKNFQAPFAAKIKKNVKNFIVSKLNKDYTIA